MKDKTTIRFIFKDGSNRELPMILGQIPVLSRAYWSKRDFTATTLDIPVNSGAYTIETFEVGRYVLYKRVPNYWAKDLPQARGLYNFEHVRYEYFRDMGADSCDGTGLARYDHMRNAIHKELTEPKLFT